MHTAIGRWSLPIGEVLGCRVRLHWTFLVLLVFMALRGDAGGRGAVVALAFTVGLVGCLIVHETGHAMVARALGARTRDVVLYPIGGVSRLDRGLTPAGDLLVAVGGPIAQLGAILVLGVAVALGADRLGPEQPGLVAEDGLLALLLAANVLIVGVNLVPVWPLDGGRFVRAALGVTLDPLRAPLAAARVGQVFAVLVALSGVLFPPLILLGGVLLIGASQEVAHQKRAQGLRHLRAGDAMIRRFETIPPHESLGRAGERLLGSTQRSFPVIDGWGRVAGMLTRGRLLAGLDRIGPDGTVGDAMDREVRSIDVEAPLDRIAEALSQEPGTAFVVIHEGRVAGLITRERIGEILSGGAPPEG